MKISNLLHIGTPETLMEDYQVLVRYLVVSLMLISPPWIWVLDSV